MRFNIDTKIGNSKINIKSDKTNDGENIVDVNLDIDIPEDISSAIKTEIIRRFFKMPYIIFNSSKKKKKENKKEIIEEIKEDKHDALTSISETLKTFVKTIDKINSNIPDPRNK